MTQEVSSSSRMDELLSSGKGGTLPQPGDTVTGKVLSASKNEVHIDLGGVASGVVRGPEVEDESGEYDNIKIGNEVSAVVLEQENENGQIELSFKLASHARAWDKLEALVRSGEIVDADIADANRGGLMIKVGKIPGFLPVSQLPPDMYPRVEGGDKNRILAILTGYVGKKVPVKILDVDETDAKLIVSAKDAWAETEKDKLDKYKVGDTVEGNVTGVVDFGAFVEFGEGLEGLVHISEIAWQRIDDPRDYLKRGQRVKAQVIQVDGTKISLSLKRLQIDPWKQAVDKYKVGDVVSGKVLKINPFGVFVELDEEIHGLAHVSELSTKKVDDPHDMVKEGNTYVFKIISIEPNNHRLGLSMKALQREAQVKKFEEEKKQDAEDGEKKSEGAKEETSKHENSGKEPKEGAKPVEDGFEQKVDKTASGK